MLEAGDMTIEVDLPKAFINACQQYHVNPEYAIQYFIEHLSPFTFFHTHIDYEFTWARDVVFEYFKTFTGTRELENREAQIACVNELIEIINAEEFDLKAYKKLLNRWYQSFFNQSTSKHENSRKNKPR